MVSAAQPRLEAGRVYRTRDLRRWGANPTRLAKRLVESGTLVQLGHGLYAGAKVGRFGLVPPAADDVMRAFLNSTHFVFTGPEKWNALSLGSTAVFAAPLVYNSKRTGLFVLGGIKFNLRRVAFPDAPPPEWFIVDLFENAASAGVDPRDLASKLRRRMATGAFNCRRLASMADQCATRVTRTLIMTALALD